MRPVASNFIDTNVLLNLASADPDKAARAEEIVAGGGTISVQALNELANVARRKMLLSWDETNELLATLRDSSPLFRSHSRHTSEVSTWPSDSRSPCTTP
jgi:predicted nucleic acid-binding protein